MKLPRRAALCAAAGAAALIVVAPHAGAAPAGYVGIRWRLTGIAEGATATVVPADAGAVLELRPGGTVTVDDTVNATNAAFTVTGTGFDVRDPVSGLVGYVGRDPVVLAVIAASRALTSGPGGAEPAHVRVVSAGATALVLDAGPYRLSYVGDGPSAPR